MRSVFLFLWGIMFMFMSISRLSPQVEDLLQHMLLLMMLLMWSVFFFFIFLVPFPRGNFLLELVSSIWSVFR